MLLTMTTTYQPATDLGFLLHKNPFRCQSVSLSFGTAHVFYPEATPEKCTVAVLLDVNPVEIIRGKRHQKTSMPLEQYVNDRPYVCSSFMSVALSQLFGQAMNGRCKQRPELVNATMPLSCKISALPCRGGEDFLRRLFEPLGYTVTAQSHPLDEQFTEWGDSSYYTVRLDKETTVVELLNHLYVLIPVLDNHKHYYVDKAEIEKLLKRGEGWLADHPEKHLIARRYLKYRSSYAKEALARLIEDTPLDSEKPEQQTETMEELIEQPLRLNDERLGTAISVLKSIQAESVLDLGCGDGKLLKLLLKERQFQKILGMDVSIRSLEIAAERLNYETLPLRQKERIKLMHGSLMYRDARLEGFDAAVILEVIEHLDEPRLNAFGRVIFQYARPKTVILSTPNREYNVMWENVGSEKLRHHDHRFEWTRTEFSNWASRIAEEYEYNVRFLPVGTLDERVGAPTQMGIFTRQ